VSYDFDLLCLGSGPAGQRAAVQAAKLGFRAAVVEKGRVVGGVCVDTGTIPSKTFREAVLSFTRPARTVEQGPGEHGAGAMQPRRPTIQQLLARVAEVRRRECDVIHQQLDRNDVALVWGRAVFEDPHTVIVHYDNGHHRITAERILVAVGTEPAQPPGAAPDGQVVLTSDDILNMSSLPRTIAVVGAGVIGLEYASMFSALGVPVTLVEKRDRFLEFLDHEIVDELMHQMRKRGVVFRLGETVERLDITEGPPRRAALLLESGKRIVSDAVVFSAGRMGATSTLNLGAAGLEADERGRLKVDENFRSAVPHIYAAGDVIGYPSLAATSSEQGRLAACHSFGVAAGSMARHFPIGIYSIPEISMVGATEEELTRQRVPYETGVARYQEIARGQILGDDSGFFKMLFHRDGRELLGVHTIGSGATELIHIGQAVVGLGGGLDYFLHTIFNYPTLAECYKVAALDAANKLAR
jgi:NAD(P) transhydrogenase